MAASKSVTCSMDGVEVHSSRWRADGEGWVEVGVAGSSAPSVTPADAPAPDSHYLPGGQGFGGPPFALPYPPAGTPEEPAIPAATTEPAPGVPAPSAAPEPTPPPAANRK